MEVVDAKEILEAKLNPVVKLKRITTRKKRKRITMPKSKKTPVPRTRSFLSIEECRFCLIKINMDKKNTFLKLTKTVEKKFFDLTQRSLKDSDQFSKFLCIRCEKRLNNALDYREKLISVQVQLESQINLETFENVVVKCEVKDEDFDSPVDIFSTTNIFEQFDEELPSPPPPPTPPPPEPEIKPQRRRGRIPRREKNDKKVVCPECGQIYCDKQTLKKHISNIHIRHKKFICDHCGYSSTTKHSLKSHLRKHLNPEDRRIHQCDQCTFISVCPNSLKRHQEYEHSGVKYECNCGRTFKQRGTLQLHIKQVHEKIRNHFCSECGKGYFKKRDLDDHIKMRHSPNIKKNFHCDQCGKAFITRKRLMRHMIYHTELSFRCTHCEKAYHEESKLKRHMKLHQGKRDLLCHLCDSAYFFTRDLQRHLDVVHKQTIYFCEFCSFTNSRKDYLGNHLRSAHAMHDTKERNQVVNRAKFIRNNV